MPITYIRHILPDGTVIWLEKPIPDVMTATTEQVTRFITNIENAFA